VVALLVDKSDYYGIMRSSVNINFNFKDLKINRLIRLFVISDLLFWSGWGFITPIFALFRD